MYTKRFNNDKKDSTMMVLKTFHNEGTQTV